MQIEVKPFTSDHRAAWLEMRAALYEDADYEELSSEIDAYFASGGLPDVGAALGAFDSQGVAVGFAEVSVRSHAEGCYSGRVGYLEGWYVMERVRKHGIGTALLKGAEKWAKAQGCHEFASDAIIGNDVSIAAHKALGFIEVERIVTFRKEI